MSDPAEPQPTSPLGGLRDAAPGGESLALPARVRQRVVALASMALGELDPDHVPPALRAVARFAPARRARAGATAIATALDRDPLLRQRVAAVVRRAHADLADALDHGVVPAATDPTEVAAIAYLVRPARWVSLVLAAAAEEASAEDEAARRRAESTVARLQAELEAVRTEALREVADHRSEADRARAEAAEARRRARRLEADLGRARAEAQEARTQVEDARASAERTAADNAAEVRRLRARVAEADAGLDAARRSVREARGIADARLRLLLDTVVEAAHGLRQELALPPVQSRPADTVAAELAAERDEPTAAGVRPTARALADDDAAVLDELLALPRVHLVVDGYNVTKTGYGALTLSEQRSRLVGALAALAGRTRAEVTCVFDGTTLEAPVPSGAPRGVRVVFSPEGHTADEVIRRLVRAEPPGRPVVVVSSDREVADGVAQAGAYPVAAVMLLRRLDRA